MPSAGTEAAGHANATHDVEGLGQLVAVAVAWQIIDAASLS